MAGLMDRINNKDTSLDKTIAETTMQCLREMRKQSGENVELVKNINDLVEASITKIKKIEARLPDAEQTEKDKQEFMQELENVKSEFSDQLTMFKNEMDEQLSKENSKLYKSIKIVMDENSEEQYRAIKSLKIYMKGIIWFVCLIAILLIANIIGII